MQKKLKFDIGGRVYDLAWAGADGEVQLTGTVDGHDLKEIAVQALDEGDHVAIMKNGKSWRCAVVRQSDGVWVNFQGRSYFARFVKPGPASATGSGSSEVRSPMTGTLLQVNVAVGDRVEAGQVLAVLEAMKMEYKLEAEVTGTVAEILRQSGDRVEVGTTLVKLDPDSDA